MFTVLFTKQPTLPASTGTIRMEWKNIPKAVNRRTVFEERSWRWQNAFLCFMNSAVNVFWQHRPLSLLCDSIGNATTLIGQLTRYHVFMFTERRTGSAVGGRRETRLPVLGADDVNNLHQGSTSPQFLLSLSENGPQFFHSCGLWHHQSAKGTQYNHGFIFKKPSM